MSTLIALGSITFLHSISLVAKVLLNDVAQLVIKDIKEKGVAPETLSKFTKLLLEQESIYKHEMINYSLFVAKNTTQFQLSHQTRLVSWIESNGNSIITYLEPDGTYSTAVMKPHATPSVHTQYFRDKEDRIIKTIDVPLHDFRTIPSYILAKKLKKFVWTDAFLSYPYKNLTTAASTPIYNKQGQLLGVFAIDIKLEGLSYFLESLTIGKNGIAFIINKKNNLIAFPGMKQWIGGELNKDKPIPLNYLRKPWIEAAVKQYDQNPQPDFQYEYANKQYIANFTVLPETIPEVAIFGWKIVVVVPQSDFTAGLERRNIIVIGIGVAILLFGLVLAAYLSKIITTRLKSLVIETERIKNFKLKGDKITSAIKEVDLLASAIYSMKINLRSFQKYMPAKLVRQLIATGEDAQLGGEKKMLSILFSDIKNFTHISESMDTMDLMAQLSEYLNNLSIIITKSNGTIDKFIGDSIMAFWGAPLQDEFHWEHACRAALACKDKLNTLNTKWMQLGKTPFITRFGIHTGEVIVGNIGSRDRMNYTALGDSVNFTSRLEQMSKVYGTTIISSEEIADIAKNKFIFRKLDKTYIRGKSGAYTLYELLAEHNDTLDFDVKAYQIVFDRGFDAYQHQKWQEAIGYFKKALEIYPQDTVVLVFIDRCEYFIKMPPSADWDGVWKG
jgi:adenylate cyclase